MKRIAALAPLGLIVLVLTGCVPSRHGDGRRRTRPSPGRRASGRPRCRPVAPSSRRKDITAVAFTRNYRRLHRRRHLVSVLGLGREHVQRLDGRRDRRGERPLERQDRARTGNAKIVGDDPAPPDGHVPRVGSRLAPRPTAAAIRAPTSSTTASGITGPTPSTSTCPSRNTGTFTAGPSAGPCRASASRRTSARPGSPAPSRPRSRSSPNRARTAGR